MVISRILNGCLFYFIYFFSDDSFTGKWTCRALHINISNVSGQLTFSILKINFSQRKHIMSHFNKGG